MIEKGKVCVLIDDDDDDQLIFSTTLNKYFPEYAFMSFSSFTKAQEALNDHANDIGAVFIDLNMPRVDGKESLTLLRENPMFEQTPLIIYSTSNNPDDVNECLKNGATAFITKPSKIVTLIDELSNYFLPSEELKLKG
ncbi:MAG: response regulator [Brumimicrobium sp.]